MTACFADGGKLEPTLDCDTLGCKGKCIEVHSDIDDGNEERSDDGSDTDAQTHEFALACTQPPEPDASGKNLRMVVFNSAFGAGLGDNGASSSDDNNGEVPLPDNLVLGSILFSGAEHATWFGRDAPTFVDDGVADSKERTYVMNIFQSISMVCNISMWFAIG